MDGIYAVRAIFSSNENAMKNFNPNMPVPLWEAIRKWSWHNDLPR